MKRPIGISIALFCFLALLASTLGFMACGTPSGTNAGGGMLASPSPSITTIDCSATGVTSEAIRKAIYDELAKSKYADQEWQFNITVDAAAKQVSITGYSAGYQDVINIVKSVAVGCSLDTNIANTFKAAFCDMNANYRVIRSCPQGYFPCGDVCIQQGDYCKITAGEGPTAPSTNTNTTANRCLASTPTPTPSPASTTKTNSNTKAP